jgi:signal peptidase I
MFPTFRPGQVLYLQPEVREVRPGDIIVYSLNDKYIVHRVHSVDEAGYCTRGDNNNFIDDLQVRPEQIVGIVDEVETGQTIRPVLGGRKGLWIARLRWSLKRVGNAILKYAGAPYRWLRANHWVVHLWHPVIIRVILNKSNYYLVKYIYHGKTIANWSSETHQFTCKKPFDLVVFPPKKSI